METHVSNDKVDIKRIYDPESFEGNRIKHDTPRFMQKAEIDNFLAILRQRKVSFSYKLIKRFMDISVSALVLLCSLAVQLFIAIYIKRNSAGPVIFKQIRIKKNRRNLSTTSYYLDPKSKKMLKDRRKHKDIFWPPDEEERKTNPGRLYYFCQKDKTMKPDQRRVNLFGQPFTFYKFRTMYTDAKERFREFYAYQYTKEEINRLKFKIKDDPRVPEWAKWLRATSFDELPNFVNVLLGDMSLVGPRPEIPEMMKYYTDEQRIKLDVKPGITGLAQIEGRGNLKLQETLKYDIEYVKNQSLSLDLKIIAKTIKEIIKRNGAY